MAAIGFGEIGMSFAQVPEQRTDVPMSVAMDAAVRSEPGADGAEGRDKGEYWASYYASRTTSNNSRLIPSQFATFLAGELGRPHRVVELGCGSGRDALFLAGYGHDVLGVDAAEPAVQGCTELARTLQIPARFLVGAVDDPALAQRIGPSSTPTVLYARFFLHAITDEEEVGFFDLAETVTTSGDLMAVEYRTVRDMAQQKVTAAHFRRYLQPTAFQLRAAQRGFEVEYAVEGFGFAKYDQDDAYVARVMLRRV